MKAATRETVFPLIVLLSIFAFVFSLPLFNFTTLHRIYSIVLTENGFEPSELTINKGDTIIFSTTLNRAFWPASDLHPTHDIYPEFDPTQPMKPNQSWSFSFNKIGEWTYHDHLSPFHKGTINVIDKFAIIQQKTTEDCDKVIGQSEKIQCWRTLIDYELKNNGIDAAFETIAKLYAEDTIFSAQCHSYTHELGENAYERFSQNNEALLSQKSSYCGYGFYHGFMETLITSGGSYVEAQEFCNLAGRELVKTTFDAGGACYHGIGHGMLEGALDYYGNISKVNSPQSLIDPALEICEKVSGTEHQLWRCATGVYNAIEILMSQGRYGLKINQSAPFDICAQQLQKYQSACYPNMIPPLLAIAHNDFVGAKKFIENIIEDEYAITAMNSLVVETSRIYGAKAENVQRFIDYCRNLQDRLQLTCITSIAEGLLKYGQPENEYAEAIKFCKLTTLTATETDACFKRVLSLLRILYSSEKISSICSLVEEKYRQYCWS